LFKYFRFIIENEEEIDVNNQIQSVGQKM